MKKFVFYLILIGALNISYAQKNTDEAALKTLVQKSFDDVFSDLKIERMPDYFTDDFLLLEHAEVWDVPKLKNMLKNGNMKDVKRINDFEFIQIKVDGNTAWLAYHNKATFKKGDKIVGEMKWLESATAIKISDGWRMEMLHSTRKPKQQ